MSRNVLITGATSGLGLALARLYAEDSSLVLIGRRPLAELDDPLFREETYCRCDLALADCGEVIAGWLKDRGIDKLELVIHNAGVGAFGPVDEQTPEEMDKLLEVNLYAPIRLTHALLPSLKRARGKLVFISSVAADLPAPDYAVYSATKAGLSGFARNLRLELGAQVAVQTLYPGAIRTGIHAKSGVPEEQFDLSRFPSPDEVAQQALRAIEHGRPNVTFGLGNKLLRAVGRYSRGPVDSVMRWRR